jgi:predicted metal-dependent phosphoesterase TrpH
VAFFARRDTDVPPELLDSLRRKIVIDPRSKADLHIHTVHSDGTATVPQVLQHVAANTDLRVVAITDHDTIAGAREAQRLARDFGVHVIMGEEVSTQEGHLLALFIDTWLPPGRPAAETIAAVHAQGGLCIAAHPFDHGIPSMGMAGLRDQCAGQRRGAWPLDALEGFNAGIVWPRRHANAVAQQVAAELALPVVGGSDSHSLPTIGRGVTTFRGSSADDVYRAIVAGEVRCGGRPWHTGHYVGVGWRYLRQRTLRGALRVAFSDGAVPLPDLASAGSRSE